MTRRTFVGVDVGGSAIKGAAVEPVAGKLAGERTHLRTPKPATPAAIAEVVGALIEAHPCVGPVGITLPCVVRRGTVETAANIDRSWIGTDAVDLFGEVLGGRPVVVLNDADAAGLAEAAHGAAAGQPGTVLVLTFGTGIGSALLRAGRLVPNTELGHVPVDGRVAERSAAASVREAEGLSWVDWSERVNRYLQVVETLVRVDLLVIGGGISSEARRWRQLLVARAPIVPAALGNDAGIIGAAMCATDGLQP